MGLKALPIVIVQFILLGLILTLESIPIIALLKIFIFEQANIAIIYVAMLLSTIGSFICFIFFVYTASPLIGLLYLGTIFFKSIVIDPQTVENPLPGIISYMLCLIFPQQGLNQVLRIAMTFESRGGLNFSNINDEVFLNTALYNTLAMLASIILFSGLIIWLWPISHAKDGAKVPLCYCCKRSRHQHVELEESLHEELLDPESSNYLLKDEADLVSKGEYEFPNVQQFVKSDEAYLQGTFRISQLVKEFKQVGSGDKKRAVDNLSLSVYKNQILALLGHNGAGKTTTISIINGLMKETSGQVTVQGIDVLKQRDTAQKIIGICPQEDVLFFGMTVQENINYFGGIRLMTQNQIKNFSETMLRDFQLESKKDCLVKTLSGGQKRKLQLIISLCGDTKVVLLDEPSSGMDPTARRDTWEFLKKEKKNRIIVLTTHYMDEADELGDRIAIMSKGKLKCCGSSQFLKKKYGLGLLIEIVQIDQDQPMNVLESFLQTYQIQPIEGKLDESNMYVVKLQEGIDFQGLFEQLDQRLQEFNIKTYNLRKVSLEEVFYKIGEEEYKKSMSPENQEITAEDEEYLKGLQFGNQSNWQIIKALFRQRRLTSTRRGVILIFLIFALMCGLNLMIISRQPQQPFLDLNSYFQMRIGYVVDDDTMKFMESQAFGDTQIFQVPNYTDQKEYNGAVKISELSQTLVKGTVYANQTAPIALQMMAAKSFEATVQQLSDKPVKLSFVLDPLPPQQLLSQAPEDTTMVFVFVSTFLSFLVIAPNKFLVALIKEHQSGVRKQLLMAGVKFKHHYVVDWLIEFNYLLMIYGIVLAFSTWVIQQDLEGIWLPFLLYCLVQPFWSKLLFLCLKDRSVNIVKFVNLAASYIVVAVGALLIAILDINQGQKIPAMIIESVLSIVPIWAVTLSYIKIVYRARFYLLDGVPNIDSWSYSGCRIQLYGMALGIIIFPMLSFIIQRPRTPQASKYNKSKYSGDPEVNKEAERVDAILQGAQDQESITVGSLTKSFGDLEAVKGISFSLKTNESFILLGINGAGKSTTFKCLTAEHRMSSGKISLDGTDIEQLFSDPQKMGGLMGYCPQTNPIIDMLTVRENLVLYATIHGIDQYEVQRFANIYTKKFEISQFSNKLAGNLSGGNKRKLITAIAMLGKPKIIFLDESSAGVDPYARRVLWKTIRQESKNSALIVTTHSLEEAEALGTKMAIMVSGEFRCFGTALEIKQRFGKGFTLELRIDYSQFVQLSKTSLNVANSETNEIFAIVREALSELNLDESYMNLFEQELSSDGLFSEQFEQSNQRLLSGDLSLMIKELLILYQVSQISSYLEQEFTGVIMEFFSLNLVTLKFENPNNKTIGHLVGQVSNIKDQFGIKDFEAKQTSLEQIFNSFAKAEQRKVTVVGKKNVRIQTESSYT